jgi:hypothetical protein
MTNVSEACIAKAQRIMNGAKGFAANETRARAA